MTTHFTTHRLSRLLPLVCILSLFTPTLLAAQDASGQWDGRFSTPGVSGGGIIEAVADADGRLYVAGPFLAAGGNVAVGVAMWDGTQWHALGQGATTGVVTALAVGPDGALYAAGGFTEIRGVAAQGIARWDGSGWSAVGSGLDNLVISQDGFANEGITELAFGPGGTLYAGGTFTSLGGVAASNVAQWDGSTWSAMGGGFDNTVLALAAAADGTVYAGGRFGDDSTDGFYEKIARWNGSGWTTLIHVTEPIFDLAVASDGTIYAAGDFLFVDGDITDGDSGVRVNQFMQSTNGGVSWSGVQVGDFIGFQGSPPNASNTSRSQVLDLAFGSDGTLYVSGEFDYVTDVEVRNVAAWKDGVWSPLGAGVGDDDTYAWDAAPTADGVYVVGGFVQAGDLSNIGRVARWTGTAWATLGSGLTSTAGGAVSSLAADAAGDLYVAGFFNGVGGRAAANAAQWDGDRWMPIGTEPTAQVGSMVVAPDGTIYGSGTFIRSNFTTFNLARWNGTAWEAVGDITGILPPTALAVDSQGRLYAGGAFTMLQGQPVPGGLTALVMWDGTAWSSVGGGVNIGVDDILIDGDDRVYIGGPFRTVGGQAASRVAMWDGAVWTTFGPGLEDRVTALALDGDGTLYAGGDFEYSVVNEPLLRIAMWDGTAWQPVGAGFNDRVEALAYDDEAERLYAGGDFTMLADGSASLNYLAAWDVAGSTWTELGGGLDGEVAALHLMPDVGLFVGGTFRMAGDFLSPGLALWRPGAATNVSIDVPIDGTTPTAFVLEANYPNPFNPMTRVPFRLNTPMHVRLTVHDVLGREVATLLDGPRNAGRHEAVWDAAHHASGLYLYRLESGPHVAQRTMVLVK